MNPGLTSVPRVIQYPGAMQFHLSSLLLTAAVGLYACSDCPDVPGPVPNGGGNGNGEGRPNGGEPRAEVPLADLLDPLPLDSQTTGALHGVVSVVGYTGVNSTQVDNSDIAKVLGGINCASFIRIAKC